jgi:DNA mismatch repair protein MutS
LPISGTFIPETQTLKRMSAPAGERLASRKQAHEPAPVQLTIFTPLNAEVVNAIENVDLDNLKPIEALNLLAELKKQIQ